MSRSDFPTSKDSFRGAPLLSEREICQELAKINDAVVAIQTQLGKTGDISTTNVIGQLSSILGRVQALESTMSCTIVSVTETSSGVYTIVFDQDVTLGVVDYIAEITIVGGSSGPLLSPTQTGAKTIRGSAESAAGSFNFHPAAGLVAGLTCASPFAPKSGNIVPL